MSSQPSNLAAPFSGNPMGDKRNPMGGAPILGQPGPFPQMFPPAMGGMPGMPGMPGMGGMGGMGPMAGPIPGGMPGPMGGMYPGLQIGGMPMGGFQMMPPFMRDRASQKDIEFAKGLFIEDFEETVTAEMLFKHFNDIKPVNIIKFPTNEKRLSKKFAFVYFRSVEDAKFVKEAIEADIDEEERALASKASQSELNKLGKKHRILKKTIRVSTLAVNRTSKLMLEPKAGLAGGYFNVKNLEREIKRILAPFAEFKLNKVVIPKDPKDQSKDLPYARVFFDLRQQTAIDDVREQLEKDVDFSKNVEVKPFNPPPKYSNMLYINNFVKRGESGKGLELEIKEFFRGLNPIWEIESVHIEDHVKGAWGYVTFKDKKSCKEAHEHMKNNKPKFRGNRIFSNIKNEVDPRAVVIYNLKSTITQEQIDEFLGKVAANSKKIAALPTGEGDAVKPQDDDERRIFDFYSSCIVDQTKFTHNFTREEITVPRRVIISFVDSVEKPERVLELCGEIEALPEYKDYFESDGIKICNLKYVAKPQRLMGHLDYESTRRIPVRHTKHSFSDKRKDDRQARNPTDRADRKNFQQRRPPVKTGYTPIMNMPRAPPNKVGGFPGMGRPGMGPRPNLPFTGMIPPNLAPTGMGGIPNPMGGSIAGRPQSKPVGPQTGVVGMQLPSNLNPLTQMSYVSGMRPQVNPMGGNPMGGNPMGGNPMGGNPMGGNMGMNPMGMNPMGGNPMMNNPMAGGSMMNPMMGGKMGMPPNPMMNPTGMGMGKPFTPATLPAADKKPTGESDK